MPDEPIVTAPAGGTPPPPAPATPPAVDYTAVYAALKPENKEVFARKGFDKSGANGGPADVNVLLDTIRHQDGLIGKNNLPTPNLVDEKELASWPGWKALGVPENGKGYKIERLQMPNGADGKPIPYDEKMEAVVLQALAEGGASQARVQRAYNVLATARLAEAQALQQEIANDKIETDRELSKAYGANKDKIVAVAGNAMRQLAEKIGVDPASLSQDVNERMGSAGVVKLFAYLAQNLGEDVIVPSDGRPGDVSTPAGAKATIAQKEGDPVFIKALQDPGDPGHAQAVALRKKLYAIANGE